MTQGTYVRFVTQLDHYVPPVKCRVILGHVVNINIAGIAQLQPLYLNWRPLALSYCTIHIASVTNAPIAFSLALRKYSPSLLW